MSEVVLELKQVQVAYGGIKAVKGIDLEVRQGEWVSLVGANGAQDHHPQGHHRLAAGGGRAR